MDARVVIRVSFLILSLAACETLSIDTIESCSMESESVLGFTVYARINCTNQGFREIQSPNLSDKWAEDFRTYRSRDMTGEEFETGGEM